MYLKKFKYINNFITILNLNQIGVTSVEYALLGLLITLVILTSVGEVGSVVQVFYSNLIELVIQAIK
jgi:Flp pilus assembly pilin Flp